MERAIDRILLDFLHTLNGLGDQLTDFLDSYSYNRLSICSRRFRVYLIVPPSWPWATVLLQIFYAEGLRIVDGNSALVSDSDSD